MGEQQKPGFNFEREDIEKNKVMAILAYILFLIPLLAVKDSPFSKFHTNQGLILFIAAIIINIVGYVLPFIGWLIILPFGNLFVLILAIIGIINAANGTAKPLPLIGNFTLLK